MAFRLVAVAAASLGVGSGSKVAERVRYMAAGVECEGYMTYDDALCTSGTKCPGVMVIQDWNGMNEYEMARACMVADMGYVAFAADIYGVDTPVDTMSDWMAASGAHASNATMYMDKIHGAFMKMLEYDFVDADKLAAMGYCFGGTGVINLALVGHNGVPGLAFPPGLLGVVSYHGGLGRGWALPQIGTRPKLLLHSGSKDDANDDISNLTDDLESVGAVYEISRYGPNVVHTFTDWDAYVPGMSMYDPLADERSWEATGHFFEEIFATGVSPEGPPEAVPGYVTEEVPYVADGVECLGYVAYDPSVCTAEAKCPAVMVIQDWDGMNDYEKARANLLAKAGYVAFAADIYGVGTPVETMADWMAASGSHSSNATRYMSKIHGALTKMMEYDFVDADKLAALGYCFGGTGVVNLAMVGHSGLPGITFPPGLLGIVSYHGGLSAGYAAPAPGGTRPKLLLHSGGKDDANDDISKLTDDLEGVGAVYEITRYGPNVAHSFTKWDAAQPGWAMYDPRADFRSWADTLDFLHEVFTAESLGSSRPSEGQCDMDPVDTDYAVVPEPGHTCGEIRAAYKASECCGAPEKPFSLPHSGRRLSAARQEKDLTRIVSSVSSALRQARAEGGAAMVAELTAKIRGIVAHYT